MSCLPPLRPTLALVTAIAVSLFAAAAPAAVVADSAADFPAPDNTSTNSKQGINNWTYGYHGDPVAAGFSYSAGDFIPFPDNQGSGTSPTDFWDGAKWDWHAGNPPWTAINQTGGHPNGTNNGPEHWAIRRWTSEVNGAANVTMNLNKNNTSGNGVSGRVFVNGDQQAAMTIPGNATSSRAWTVHVPDLTVGDAVDVVLDPTGPSGDPNDGSDGSTYGMVVDHVQTSPTALFADSIADFPAPDNITTQSKQGINNWNYGYHNASVNGSYEAMPGGTDDFIAFPDNQGPGTGPSDYWTGSTWDWHAGNPPWTQITASGGHPNGTNNGDEHWAVRRWVAETGGTLFLESFLAKQNTNGGTGTTLLVFHNGTQMFSRTVGGTDGVGFFDVTQIDGVSPGDFIDLALTPNGADGNDGSFFSARIFGPSSVVIPEPSTLAVWSLLGALGLAAAWRRRHAAVA